MDSTIAGSVNDNINMNSTITRSMNDNINMDSTIAGSMNVCSCLIVHIFMRLHFMTE
jgi:hypothetical protein